MQASPSWATQRLRTGTVGSASACGSAGVESVACSVISSPLPYGTLLIFQTSTDPISGHDRGSGEQRRIAARVDQDGRDRPGQRGGPDDRDVDDAEVLGPVLGGRQHLGDERLVDGQVGAEPGAEQDGGAHRGGPGLHEREQQRRGAHQRAGDRDDHLALADPVGDDPADDGGDDHEAGVDRDQDEQALGGLWPVSFA